MSYNFQPVIHLGYPKAGSSSLQHRLFFDNPKINYLSRNRPAGEGNELQKDPQTSEFYQRIFRETDFDVAQMLAFWQSHFGPWVATESINLLSEEGLTLNVVDPLIVAERLLTLFPAAKIIIILRQQQDVLRSLYDMHPYRRNDENKVALKWHNWLTYTLASREQTLAGSLDCARVITKCREMFGRGNVSVFLFERLFQEDDEMRRLAEMIGLEPLDTIRRLREPPANTQSSRAFRNLGRRINGRFHLSSVLPPPAIRQLVRLGSRFYRGRKTEIRADDLARIAAVYVADNRRTATLLGEDLAPYGYLMDDPPTVAQGAPGSV